MPSKIPKPSTPRRPSHESTVLVLQGGGALGAYQAGVYEGMHEAGIDPNWITGVSIGAINAALIAGNRPENRIARLREFWERVSSGVPLAVPAPFERAVLGRRSRLEHATVVRARRQRAIECVDRSSRLVQRARNDAAQSRG